QELESAFATQPDRTPAVHGTTREPRAGALLTRAHGSDGRLQLHARHGRTWRRAAVAHLSAVVRPPAEQRGVRSNGAAVVVARRNRGPAQRGHDALEKRTAARDIAKLAVVVASPAVRFVGVGDAAGVRAAGTDG